MALSEEDKSGGTPQKIVKKKPVSKESAKRLLFKGGPGQATFKRVGEPEPMKPKGRTAFVGPRGPGLIERFVDFLKKGAGNHPVQKSTQFKFKPTAERDPEKGKANREKFVKAMKAIGRGAREVFSPTEKEGKARDIGRGIGKAIGRFGTGFQAGLQVPGDTGTGLEGLAAGLKGFGAVRSERKQAALSAKESKRKMFESRVKFISAVNRPGTKFSDEGGGGFLEIPKEHRDLAQGKKFFKPGERKESSLDIIGRELQNKARRASLGKMKTDEVKALVGDLDGQIRRKQAEISELRSRIDLGGARARVRKQKKGGKIVAIDKKKMAEAQEKLRLKENALFHLQTERREAASVMNRKAKDAVKKALKKPVGAEPKAVEPGAGGKNQPTEEEAGLFGLTGTP